MIVGREVIVEKRRIVIGNARNGHTVCGDGLCAETYDTHRGRRIYGHETYVQAGKEEML